MEIRKAVPEDEEAFFNLLKEWPGVADDNFSGGEETFKRITENAELGSIFLATEDNELIGLITQSFVWAVRAKGQYSAIEEFLVSESGRGKGVGTGLLKAAITEAREKKCCEVQVNGPSELGYPLYVKQGIEDVGKHLKIKL
jgi:GNAT superfamily N-acetyltransferase